MPVNLLRKERAVGIYAREKGQKLSREQLEETVLVTQRVVEMSDAGRRIPFCAFNGGNDVSRKLQQLSASAHVLTPIPQIFVDIGDKSWGVQACQRYFGGIHGSKSLHVGDQFLSAGANDFKVCTRIIRCLRSDSNYLIGEISMHNILDRKPSRNSGIIG